MSSILTHLLPSHASIIQRTQSDRKLMPPSSRPRLASSLHLFLLVATCCLASACSDTDEHTHENHEHGEETTTLTLALAPMVHGEPFSCQESYTLGSTGQEVSLTDFKLFLSEVTLLRSGGEEVTARILTEEPWQYEGVALLDFEDASGSCANGTPQVRHHLRIKAPTHDDYTGVRATIGVPFELNHEDVSALPSPLNLPSMFWSWQGGRKFFRLDGKLADGSGLRVHLGSTGCMGDQGDISLCQRPNRARFEVSGHDPTSHLLLLHVDELFSSLDLTPAMETPDASVICMSGPDTPPCEPIFEALGVNYATGELQQSSQRFISLSDNTFDPASYESSGEPISSPGGDAHHEH